MGNKNLYKYLLLGIVYYAVTFSYSQSFLGYDFIKYGLTDKYYCFQFAIFFLCGCSLIDWQFLYMAYTRYKDRKQVLMRHAASYIVMAVIQITIVFAVGIIHYLIFGSVRSSCEPPVVFLNYLLFILGTILLALLALVFRYSGIKYVSRCPQVFAYGVLILEVMVLASVVKGNWGLEGNVLFCWIFYDRSYLNVGILLLYSVVCFGALLLLAKRVDWN